MATSHRIVTEMQAAEPIGSRREIGMTRWARTRTASGRRAPTPHPHCPRGARRDGRRAALTVGGAPAKAAGTPPVAPTIDSFNANYTSVALFVTQPAPPGQWVITSYEYSVDAGAHWGPVVGWRRRWLWSTCPRGRRTR